MHQPGQTGTIRQGLWFAKAWRAGEVGEAGEAAAR
jgi:hypothetical protein